MTAATDVTTATEPAPGIPYQSAARPPAPRPLPRGLSGVVFVDGVRTPFGKAGGAYAETRADDLVVRVIRELLRRNPGLEPGAVDDVAVAAATQSGDQGMLLGRTAALLAGLRTAIAYFGGR